MNYIKKTTLLLLVLIVSVTFGFDKISYAALTTDNYIIYEDDEIVVYSNQEVMNDGEFIIEDKLSGEKDYLSYDKTASGETEFVVNNSVKFDTTGNSKFRAWTSWSGPTTYYSSLSADRDKMIVISGITMYAMGVPGGISLAIGVTSYFVSTSSKNLYNINYTYYRYDKSQRKIQRKNIIKFYKHSNYTGYVTSTSKIINVPWD